MLELRKMNLEDMKAQWEYVTALPKDENGLTNPYEGVSFEEYRDKVLPELMMHERPINMPDWFVPETYYYLWDGNILIGEFRIRHRLTEALRRGAGHIGYSIKKDCRNKGYGTKGLSLTIDLARKIVPESEIYLRVQKNNTPSIKAITKNGAYIADEDETHYFMRIPKTEALNITNGDHLNDYVLTKFGGTAVPFCEAMMDGNTLSDIYSDAFIDLRAKELNVSTALYRSKMQVYDALQENRWSTLRLWFGKDTFCQINLLMLLAFLEQIGFAGKVTLRYIDDDTFAVLENDIDVSLGMYQKLYEEVCIQKKMPDNVGVLSKNALNLYFDYHAEDGTLARFIRENAALDAADLCPRLMQHGKAYGLTDLQAKEMIARHTAK